MKASFRVLLGLAIAALLTTGLAVAQGPGVGPGFGNNRPPMERMLGPHGGHGHWWNNPTMVEKLKLTDEQRKAMDAILLEHREKLIDLRANLEKAELVLEPMMRDDQPNEATILAQIDKVAEARADLEKANARFLLAIRGKLTQEQWKALQDARMNRMNRRWQRHGDCPNGNCPGMMQRGPMGPGPGPQGQGTPAPGPTQ
ncbi:MAG TPA: Spy/CpxP family protein refolding chaperone [Terracidiphilus sp.]|nr:Spy/CpxP family protein refolding chaperone [Terracidiphilus sp.]